MTSFDEMVKVILERARISRNELMARIRQKQDELGGFITAEGAAIIIGRELGVELVKKEPEVRELTIEDLTTSMSGVDIVGRVTRVYEPRTFQRVDGSQGKVGSLTIQDQTGQIRVVLWDDKTSLLEEGKIRKGSAIQIRGAYVKQGIDQKPELNVGLRSSVIFEPGDARARNLPPLLEAKVKICDLKTELGEVDVLGRVAAISEPRTFERPDGSTGKVATATLMDGSGYVRVSLWDERADFIPTVRRGDVVKLENACVRPGLRDRPELHLGRRGRVLLNPPDPEAAEIPPLVERPLKISEVEADMQALDLAARVRRKLRLHEFKRDDGSSGQVMSVILADETGTVGASFWGGAAGIAKGLSIGDIVLIRNAYTRSGLAGPEVHVGGAARVEVNPAGVSVGELKPSRIKIGELEAGMDALEVLGRVVDVSKVREFARADGSKGKVATLVIGDETGTTRVSLWDGAAEFANQMKSGDVVRVSNAYSAIGLLGQPELHIGRQGELEVNPFVEEELPQADVLSMAVAPPERLDIAKLQKEGVRVQLRGTIVRVFHRRPLFDVCPLCGRSLGSVDHSLLCEECGKVVTPEHRAVLSFLLDDGTGGIRAVLFGRIAEKLLGMSTQQVFDAFMGSPDLVELYSRFNLLGREVILTGVTRYDRYSNQLELRVGEVGIPEPKGEAQALLEKIKA